MMINLFDSQELQNLSAKLQEMAGTQLQPDQLEEAKHMIPELLRAREGLLELHRLLTQATELLQREVARLESSQAPHI